MRVTLAAILLTLSPGASLLATDYGLDPSRNGDTVHFNSTARLEFLEGKTQNISGGFSFHPGTGDSEISGVLKVDLRTLRTGIEKRDKHMRDNHLHTEKYPFAFVELTKVEPIPELSTFDSVYTSRASGNFYIHGVYRAIELELELVRGKIPAGGEVIKVRANFAIILDEFKIPRPKALFLKLAKTIEVEVLFTGFSLVPPESIELPDWPELD